MEVHTNSGVVNTVDYTFKLMCFKVKSSQIGFIALHELHGYKKNINQEEQEINPWSGKYSLCCKTEKGDHLNLQCVQQNTSYSKRHMYRLL